MRRLLCWLLWLWFPHPFCTRKLDATECVFEKQSRRFALSHFVGGRRCVRSVAGSLTHRHVRCSEVLDVEPRNMLGPFYSAAQSGSLQKHESFASRAPLPALNGRPLDCTMPCETRWQDDRSLFTGVVHGGGSAHDGQDADLRVAGWELANTAGGQPVSVSGTLPYFIQDVDGFLRIARAPAQYVTDSSFAEQGVNQHGWKATEASMSAVGGPVACRCLGDSLSVRKIKAHTAPEAVCAGVITAEDQAGNDLADAACKLVVLEHRAPRSIRAARHSANLAVTCMAHWIARSGSARQRRDVD